MKNCPQCGTSNPDESKFCMECGNNLQPAAPDNKSIPTQSDKPGKRSPERRQLTVLFCDLVGSTPLSERLDPEEYRQVITDYHHVAEKVVQEFNGHIAQYLGDGLLVYFGYPKGLEDAAMSGVRTGLGILEAIDSANQQWKAEGRVEVKVRIGIHTGLVVVDDHLALGESVNIAARLEGLAPHNGLVISPKTLNLVQGWFEVKSIGKQTLKGISQPMEIFQVLRESAAQTRLDVAKGRGLSPLVGREKELNRLKEKWTHAKNGKGNLVLINGEAGIGKTRLVDTFEQIKKEQSDSGLIIARCSAYHQNSAFFPIINWLEKELFQFERNDATEIKLNKIKDFLLQSGMEAQAFMPLLAEFLSVSSTQYPPLVMSPFAKRQRMMDTLSQIFIQNAAIEPVLFVLEDLHWADASTLEWLNLFVKQLPSKAILVICTTRPGFHPDWADNAQVNQVNLQRLSAEKVAHICHHQTKGKSLPKELLKQINDKTEGVPLFVEELTRMVLESGMLLEKENRFELAGAVNALSIPSTLQDSLLARLDRLSPVKEIVQVGAVLGREFSFEIIQAVTQQNPDSLEQALHRLTDAELLYLKEQGEQTMYQFKHALIQDAAYESMLKSRRHQLHQQVAQVLEQQFPAIPETQPELLAHHYTQAGLPLQAIPLWLKAGQIASQKNASLEAIRHLEKGLELLPHMKSDAERKNLELDFQLMLGGTFVVAHGFPHPKVKSTFDKARAITQSIEVSPKLALILMNLNSYYANTEDFSAHKELTEYIYQLTTDPENGYWFQLAYHVQGTGTGILKGENFQVSNQSFEQTLKIFNPDLAFPWELAPSGYVEIGTKAWWMVCLQIMGYMEQSKALSDQHLKYTKDHKDSITLYHIYTFPPLRNLIARNWKAVQKGLDQYLPIVQEFGDPVFILTAEMYYAIAEAFEGNKTAFDKAVQLVNVCFDIGFSAFAVSMSAWIGELYHQFGAYESGLSWVEKILAHVNKTGTHIQTAELYRVKGLTLQALGKPDTIVEQNFQQALDLSRIQSAKTYELRAACDLAKLWQHQGKKKEAKALVQEVYNWFTGGFDSVDLKAAQALLKEL